MTDPNGPPLARVTYDRGGLHRTDDAWLADAWTRAKVVLISPGSATPVDDAARVQFVDAASAPDGPRRFLGLIDDVPYFAVTTEPDVEGWKTMREVGADLDDLEAGLVVSAVGLEQWHQRHPRCALCGEPTVEAQAGWTRRCPNDNSQHFPRTDPAVIMLVTSGSGEDELALLGRGPQWGEGRFSCLAGFVEPGESLEAAVAREVFEEVGVSINDIRYLGSQPWPFPASLMVGFVARLDGDPAITLDPVEMREAGWFSRDEVRRAATWTDDWQTPLEPAEGTRLRAIPPQFSIARYLIDRWLDGIPAAT